MMQNGGLADQDEWRADGVFADCVDCCCCCQFCVFLLHWAACAFWFIARQAGFSEETWVFAKSALLEGNSAFGNYIYSLYWAIVTFATLGCVPQQRCVFSRLSCPSAVQDQSVA